MRLAALTLLCLATIVVVHVTEPVFHFMELDDLHEGQLEAAAAMVLAVNGALQWGRFRRAPSLRLLLLTAALFVLAAADLFAAVATPIVDSLAASPFATWTVAGVGALGSVLLVVAVAAGDRTVGARAVVATAGGAILAVLLVLGGAAVLRTSLPSAFPVIPVTVEDLRTARLEPMLLLGEVLGVLAWLVAAVHLTGPIGFRWDDRLGPLGAGAVLLAAAGASQALTPSRYTELVGLGELFVVAAVGVMLLGAIRATTRSEESVVAAAIADERRRVAGELRAGVAQELALVASQADWIARQPPEGRRLDVLAASVERALDESRGAIVALSRPVDEPMEATLSHVAGELSNRLDVRIGVHVEPGPVRAREARDALVRLVRDAIVLVVRIGHASALDLDVRWTPAAAIRVVHNGSLVTVGGREPVELGAMRERVEALGGTFALDRRPDGACLEVVLP